MEQKPAFLRQGEGRDLISTASNGPDTGPEQQPDAIHDGAPAGRFFGQDLPVDNGAGLPFTTNGFAPDPRQDELKISGRD